MTWGLFIGVALLGEDLGGTARLEAPGVRGC